MNKIRSTFEISNKVASINKEWANDLVSVLMHMEHMPTPKESPYWRLQLADTRDFFLVWSKDTGWIRVDTGPSFIMTTTYDIEPGKQWNMALYVEHNGDYIIIVGDFFEKVLEERKVLPPL